MPRGSRLMLPVGDRGLDSTALCQSFCASSTEAFGFTTDRTVVFEAQGKVLHVSGDGVTDVPVMAV